MKTTEKTISVFIFQRKLEAGHILRQTNIFKCLILSSGISTTKHDKEHQIFFPPMISHFTLFMLLLTEKV